MHLPDLLPLPPDHPPSPYPLPLPLKNGDRWGYGTLPSGLRLLPVGWLASTTPSQGPPEPEVVDLLLAAYEAKLIFSDGFAGFHDCELCSGPDDWYPGGKVGPVITWKDRTQRLFGHGHYLIHNGEDVFMAPALTLHYILDHKYKPPSEFAEAVRHGRFLKPEDLVWRPEETVSDSPSA